MRLRQIEIFYHVYRAGTISGAARDLNVSQPSVSKVLRHAEDQLGIELFLRSKGRLVPTQAAHELFAEVEDIYGRLSTFSRSLENIGKRRGGHLRIAVLPSLSLSFAPDLIARLRKEDESMTFALTTLHTAEMAQALLEREADLCIGFEAIADERIVSEQIGDGQLVLVSSHSVENEQQSAAEYALGNAPVIGMHDSGPLGQLIERELAERDISYDEIVTAHTYHVALSLVRKQVGLTVTDQFTAYSHLGAGLHRHLLADWPRFPVYAGHLQDHPDASLIALALQHSEKVSQGIDSTIASLQPPKP